MEPKTLQTRLFVIRAGLILMLAIMTGRLWHLQIAKWTVYGEIAEKNQVDVVPTAAPRGTIFDRNQRALADNEVIYQVEITPAKLPRDHQQLNDVIVLMAKILDESAVDIENAVDECKRTSHTPTVLAKVGDDIDRMQAIGMDEHRAELPGVLVIESRRRRYPFGNRASHVVGYARKIGKEELHDHKELTYPDTGGAAARLGDDGDPPLVYAMDSTYGKTGLETMCELIEIAGVQVPVLQGRRGADHFEKGRLNQARLIKRVEPVRGANVYSTLDIELQTVVESALLEQRSADGRKSYGGAAVVVDVRTGDVLALASAPSTDPNKYVRPFPEYNEEVRDNERKPAFNRAVSGRYPAGSIFKMISSCVVLEQTEPRMNLGTIHQCKGYHTVGRNYLRMECWKDPPGHGWLSFNQAVAQSCDVYFYKAVTANGLSIDKLADYAKDFGLGQSTGSGIPGEIDGLVPTKEWKSAAHSKKWYPGDTCNTMIGQGYLEVTPLQMAMVTAAVANRGLLPHARIVRKIVWPKVLGREQYVFPVKEPHRVSVEPDTLDAVRRGMREAVTGPHGTARGPMGGLPFTVAAKTGSAEHHKPGDHPNTHSWFVAYAPRENPKYALCVFVEYGGHGSEVAGPIARKILLKLFAKPSVS